MEDLIRIISIENEVHVLDSLKFILKNNIEGTQFTKNYSQPDSFLQDWKAGLHDFDLLFFDLEMFSSKGEELINEVKKITPYPKFDIIFLTINSSASLSFYQHYAVDYLQKPIRTEELLICLKNWKRKKFPFLNQTQAQVRWVLDEIPKTARNQLAIPTSEGYDIIEIDQIIRCEADRNYTFIHVIDIIKPYLVCKNLKELEKALSPNGFLRVHNSHLINPVYIRKILKADGGSIKMIDSTKIRVSKNKVFTIENLLISITKL